MNLSVRSSLRVGARKSRLSQAQVEEVFEALKFFHPHVLFDPVWVETIGDLDQSTSLRTLDKTDFFTKEIDRGLLQGDFRIAVHSAKDLPDPLAAGLQLIALTKGVDPSDALVIGKKELPLGARVGTSSVRREQNVKTFRSDLACADIRGTIEKRLEQLDQGLYDAVVIAEAALIRLRLTDRLRVMLPGDGVALQGQLAVVARQGDEEMIRLFSCLDTR